MDWCRVHSLLVYVAVMVTLSIALELVALLWLHDLHRNGI